jgi:hypothetical protein
MGVGYCASSLHRITNLDTSAMTTRPPVKGSGSTLDSETRIVVRQQDVLQSHCNVRCGSNRPKD